MIKRTAISAIAVALAAAAVFTATADANPERVPLTEEPAPLNGTDWATPVEVIPPGCRIITGNTTPRCTEIWFCPAGLSEGAKARYSAAEDDYNLRLASPVAYLTTHCVFGSLNTAPASVPASTPTPTAAAPVVLPVAQPAVSFTG